VVAGQIVKDGDLPDFNNGVCMKNRTVEDLAYWLWKERGMPLGSPDEDWFLAEGMVRELEVPEPSGLEIPLFAFGLERRTR
jgi:hypothetical protein